MSTVSRSTFTALTVSFCAACRTLTPDLLLTPHYRGAGGGNFPLCPRCADTLRQVVCLQCGEPSPRELLTLGVCPCVPIHEIEALVQPFGAPEPMSEEEEARYQQWAAAHDEPIDWEENW